jgi:cytochrome c oxidase cbb3-type subunit III
MRRHVKPKTIPLSANWALSQWKISAILIASCLLLGPRGTAQSPQQGKSAGAAVQQSNNEARQIFESTCAACHGLDGRGGERGPNISTRPQVVQLSDRELGEILRMGRPAAGMPPFAALGNNTLKGLLAYVRFLQGKDAATVLPGNAANGKALFFGKARCADCHMIQGRGGFLGSDLSEYGASLSAREIRRPIVSPVQSSNANKHMAIIRLRDSQQLSGVIRNEDNFSIQLQLLDGTFRFLSRSDIAAIESSPKPIMPTNYETTLTAAELDDLVKYLRTAGRSERKQHDDEWNEED